jgi:two-component system, OmpR family, alkaline phosphatase synthesis response regulator PhoP
VSANPPAHSGKTVLVVDDDPRLRNILTWTLENGQYRVIAAPDGETALERARLESPDLYVVDVSMPGIDGFEVCRRLREQHVISPILLLTGRGDEADKVAGLEAGADDYQTKPFTSRELLARVNALLRRTNVYTREVGADVFTTGDVRVDFDQRLAFKGGIPLTLTPTEFHILAHLARTPGQIVSSTDILDKVWGPAYRDEVHLLRVNIARLRRKIEDNPAQPTYVRTHSRAGYSIAPATARPD